MATTKAEENWYSAFPAPRAKCAEITADELMQMFDDMDIRNEPRDFLLVDVRRVDWEVSFFEFLTTPCLVSRFLLFISAGLPLDERNGVRGVRGTIIRRLMIFCA